MNIHQSPQAAPSWLTQRSVSSPQALNDPTCPNCCGQALARRHVAREFRAFSCVFVHPVSGDVSCNLVQSRAISCDLVRSRAISCNLARSRAISKSLVQSQNVSCNLVRFCAHFRAEKAEIPLRQPHAGRVGCPNLIERKKYWELASKN